MKRRGFLRSLLLAPFAGLAVNVVLETLQNGVNPIPTVAKACPELLGFKGAQFLETGIIYAPYIPLYQTCNLVDPKFVKRFAQARLRKDYYETMRLNGCD